MKTSRLLAVLYLSLAGFIYSLSFADNIEEIVVTADFRERPQSEVAASITVLDGELIRDLADQHFEELIAAIPNINWSGDGHRARYLQIRGVGELEQYQGAPNPSVGFLIDDIDFSGIGTIATLYDIDRVEVLRGPQGSRYGANALGGLIYLQSVAPTSEWQGNAELTVGDEDTLAFGAAVGGPVSDNVSFRLSAHHHQSNGFRENLTLGRDDTNERNETGARLKLRYDAGLDTQVDFALMVTDVDNGYDAFALDNSYTVLSDKPGRDAQRSVGASLNVQWQGFERADFRSITTFADSDIQVGFDADWGGTESWAPFTYDFTSTSDRERRTMSQEFRLTSNEGGRIFSDSTDWLVGVYAQRLEEDLFSLNEGVYDDPVVFFFQDSLFAPLDSDYEAQNLALFGQLDTALGERTRLSIGARFESRDVDYSDSDGLVESPSENMFGGEISLSQDFSDNVSIYGVLSAGFKAGGFNLGILPDERRRFDKERLWNLEAGVKADFGPARVNASVFANRRDDQQVRTSFQLDPGDPTTFIFVTENAAKGETLGAEVELQFFHNDYWQSYLNLGLLNAEFDEFESPVADISGRAQAHAPDYTLAAGVRYTDPSGFFAALDLQAIDAFYFDVSHDERSEAYELLHARVGYESDSWRVVAWVRNLADEEYAVRGFFFANEPPLFDPPVQYRRLGDPRHAGITISRSF